tara:strand:- start:7324 stop:7470 length:147 start_codon:yes stop_codon:yes gene_type:complete
MKVSVKLKDDDPIMFETYEEAMDYIETLIPDLEGLNISTDDILIDYHG